MAWHKFSDFVHNYPAGPNPLDSSTEKEIEDFLKMGLETDAYYKAKDGKVMCITYALPKGCFVRGLSSVRGRIDTVGGKPQDLREFYTPNDTAQNNKISLMVEINGQSQWVSVPRFIEMVGWDGTGKLKISSRRKDTTPQAPPPQYMAQITDLIKKAQAGVTKDQI
mgnify:CR=1 FL=1